MIATSVELQLTGIEPATLVTGSSNSITELRSKSLALRGVALKPSNSYRSYVWYQ